MLSADDLRRHHVLLITMPYDPARSRGMPAKRRMRLVRLLRAVVATADLPVLFVAGQDSEFWPVSHAAACAVLAPMGDSIVLADDGHAANIEQPKAFNKALLGFLRAG
jgi:pimeloyl-ACP methyl ester carboxylesterase